MHCSFKVLISLYGNGELNRLGVVWVSDPIEIPLKTPHCLLGPYNCGVNMYSFSTNNLDSELSR